MNPEFVECGEAFELQSGGAGERESLVRFFPQSLLACWRRVAGMSRRPARRLRLCESLALGERRFVAVVEFDEVRFLLGGTSSSLVLLAKLDGNAGESRPKETPEEGRA